jgi:hypothetical protein
MLNAADIHSAIATQIEAALAAPTIEGPWLQSRHPYGVFLDAPEIEHHSFAIRVGSTESDLQDRQRADVGTWSGSEIRIRWAHRLRVEAAVLDTLDGYRAEAELVAAIKATPVLPLLFLTAERSDRRNGLVLVGELVWRIKHHFPLSTSP